MGMDPLGVLVLPELCCFTPLSESRVDSVTNVSLSIPETTHEAGRSFVQGCLD